tara:strand:- start:348 stop:1097 length:750 start_codon:yes stop_codon:yes gene_type:complete
MIICNSKKFIYIHIPKTGGESVEKALGCYLKRPLLNQKDLILGSTKLGNKLNKYYLKKNSLHKHSGIQKIFDLYNAKYELNDYRIGALIRDPISRCFSYFNYIANIVEKGLNEINRTKDYSYFIKRIEENDYGNMNFLKWRITKAYLESNGDPNFFFNNFNFKKIEKQVNYFKLEGKISTKLILIKLEEINSSSNLFEKLTGIKNLKIPYKNKSPKKIANFNTVRKNTIEMLYGQFKEDYEILPYSYTT